MKKFLRKPAMIICVSVLVIAGAAVSVASFKERSKTDTIETVTSIPVEVLQEESIEPVGNADVQSVAKPNMHNVSYEQQAEAIQERQSRRNEQFQLSSTE